MNFYEVPLLEVFQNFFICPLKSDAKGFSLTPGIETAIGIPTDD
jgi:hypothetical protein